MRTKKELLSVAQSMDVRAENEKFYRFAQKYISGMQRRDASDHAEFFAAVKYCSDHANQAHVRKLMGISGGDAVKIRQWCCAIQNQSELHAMTLEELNYVFGCCAHLAKVAGN